MVVLLIVAGHETTVSLIANAVHTLLTHPEQLAALRADPLLMASAVEELVRFDSPVERTITRWVAADSELGGQTLRRGELVVAIVGSANRDGAQFTGADALDLARADNRHVGFGRGPHYCLGAPLARLETEIALATLLRRLPNLRLEIAPDDLYWRPIPIFRSLAELPVAWDV
jgi:cytochrome P450